MPPDVRAMRARALVITLYSPDRGHRTRLLALAAEGLVQLDSGPLGPFSARAETVGQLFRQYAPTLWTEYKQSTGTGALKALLSTAADEPLGAAPFQASWPGGSGMVRLVLPLLVAQVILVGQAAQRQGGAMLQPGINGPEDLMADGEHQVWEQQAGAEDDQKQHQQQQEEPYEHPPNDEWDQPHAAGSMSDSPPPPPPDPSAAGPSSHQYFSSLGPARPSGSLPSLPPHLMSGLPSQPALPGPPPLPSPFRGDVPVALGSSQRQRRHDSGRDAMHDDSCGMYGADLPLPPPPPCDAPWHDWSSAAAGSSYGGAHDAISPGKLDQYVQRAQPGSMEWQARCEEVRIIEWLQQCPGCEASYHQITQGTPTASHVLTWAGGPAAFYRRSGLFKLYNRRVGPGATKQRFVQLAPTALLKRILANT